MVAFLSTLIFGFYGFSADIINAKLLFSTDVATPTMITQCQQKIWVFNKEVHKFFVISKTDGRKIAELALPPVDKKTNLTAMGCFKSNIAIAFSNEQIHTFELDENIKLKHVSTNKIPAKGLITDLKCGEAYCLAVVDGQPYKSKDLNSWNKITLPNILDITNKDINIKANPFDNWQEKLLLSKGHVTKALLISSNNFALLDPFRANIIFNKFDQWSRWGKWGAWEGDFLAPKSIAFMYPNIILAADPSLKVISLFDDDGKYLGTLGENGSHADLNYPLQIMAIDDTLFIADFFANKILAYKIATSAILKSHLNDSPTEQFRHNLFRRDEVLKDQERNRCLLCHDGTLVNSTEIFSNPHRQHPAKTNCIECHDPHHGEKSPKKPFLKMPKQELCLKCHEKAVEMGHKHDQCMDCHIIHNGAGKVLKTAMPQLCVSCHESQKFEHRDIHHLLKIDKASEVRFLNNEVSCRTCHTVHGQPVNPNIVMPFCASCHGAKAESLFKTFHQRMRRGKHK